jgi:hypothetical protein
VYTQRYAAWLWFGLYLVTGDPLCLHLALIEQYSAPARPPGRHRFRRDG